MHFLPLIFNRIEVEHWGWSQYVSLAETHRLICNMIYLGYYVTFRDLDLRSHFDLERVNKQCFEATRLKKYDGVRHPSRFICSKIVRE